jgi:hypothetical protein
VAFHVCLFSNMPEGKELVNTAESGARFDKIPLTAGKESTRNYSS